MRRGTKGITLIALVVTIVVLLILASISIGVLTGENGIIKQAIQAKEDSIIADEKEIVEVAYVKCEGDNNTGTNVTDADMEQALIEEGRDVEVTTEDGDLVVIFNDTKHRYIIDEEGNIELEKEIPAELAERIVDVVAYCDDIYVLTAAGEVRTAYKTSGFGRFSELVVDNENNKILTKKGLSKKGNSSFVDNKGRVYTWGDNYYGQLGNGTDVDSNIPICISDIQGNALNGKKIIELYDNDEFKIVKDQDGKLYSWGYNEEGRLGDGTTTNRTTPICISNIKNSPLNGKYIVDIKRKG